VTADDDWTRPWRAAGLAMTAWTSEPSLLACPRAARLLELALELTVLRHDRALHGYVVLPGALHVVAGGAGSSGRLAWPAALGRVKGSFARWWNKAHGSEGPVWQERVRIAPLPTRADVAAAVASCHAAPVAAGVAAGPAEHEASSWHALHGRPRRAFVLPP
jgi:hypothetical protein